MLMQADGGRQNTGRIYDSSRPISATKRRCSPSGKRKHRAPRGAARLGVAAGTAQPVTALAVGRSHLSARGKQQRSRVRREERGEKRGGEKRPRYLLRAEIPSQE